MNTKTDKCIHCHRCRDNCAFLSKYGIDIGDTGRLKDLAYHCFLCGTCTSVCPAGIDGRAVILDMRRSRASSDEIRAIEKEYRWLIAEKRSYKFSNWKHVTAGRAYFPGCNFPSMYPKTNARIADLFAEHGIGTVYECCGKPVAELGMKTDEDRIISGIRKRLEAAGVTEVITACPNCRAFYGERLGVSIRSVYDVMSELGIGNVVEDDIELYIPCPDRKESAWVEEIRPFIKGEIRINRNAQCCGLGGSAIRHEKEIADGFVCDLGKDIDGRIFTYCASCTGRFSRSGLKSAEHVLAAITGTHEQPDIYKSFINRVMTKLR